MARFGTNVKPYVRNPTLRRGCSIRLEPFANVGNRLRIAIWTKYAKHSNLSRFPRVSKRLDRSPDKRELIHPVRYCHRGVGELRAGHAGISSTGTPER